MIRANLPMAMQGLAVVPLFAGWDILRRRGRIFTYDITGGRYEEVDYHATGSGGRDAKATIKLGYRDQLDTASAVKLLISALLEASEEDSATGGPDPVRGIYPVIATVSEPGFKRVTDEEIAELTQQVLADRADRGVAQ
jgi:proteasome beta subunit